MWQTTYLFLVQITICFAFNIDLNDLVELKPITKDELKSDNQDNATILFGHSIAITNGMVIVGAPQCEHHGNLYKCILDSKICTKIDGRFIKPFKLYMISNQQANIFQIYYCLFLSKHHI